MFGSCALNFIKYKVSEENSCVNSVGDNVHLFSVDIRLVFWSFITLFC